MPLEQIKILHFPGLKIKLNSEASQFEVNEMVNHIRQDANFYFKKNIIKDDLATTIAKATAGKSNVIIKRINPQNWVTVLRRLFCFSRVERNWKFANVLSKKGIDTFLPIMIVHKKRLGTNHTSYLYMSEIEGTEAISYFDSCATKKQWQPMADKIIALIKKLHTLGIRHRDLNLSNMIISHEKVCLIDLDAMKQDKMIKSSLFKREREKFLDNIDYLKISNIELYNYFYDALAKESVI